MSRNSGVQVTYDRDADGLITRAGASWEEGRPTSEALVFCVLITSVFFLFAGLFVPPLLAIGFVGAVASGWILTSMRGPSRALYFDDDGQIHVPFGIHDYAGMSRIKWHAESVVSIEARPQLPQPTQNARMYEVILVSSDGDMVTLSRNLAEHVALKAAAQLTKAHNQLKSQNGAGPDLFGAWGSAS